MPMADMFLPMFTLVLLTFFVAMYMFVGRMRAVRRGEMDFRYFKTYDSGAPTRQVRQTERHFTNLFETPVLFYVAGLLALALQLQSSILTTLAWLYVALRFVHAWIHLGKNSLYPRMTAFGLSLLVLLAMWVTLAVHII